MTIRRMSLSEYADLVSHLPMPTPAQMEDMAQFVSQAHSWYKHLPILRPIGRVQFFLDPSAGMQRMASQDGTVRMVEREQTGIHYSWISTREYRRRFGYLAFSTSGGISVAFFDAEEKVHEPFDEAPVIWNTDTEHECQLPEAVLMTGMMRFSGIVHDWAAQPAMWLRILQEHLPDDWPEESGGLNGLQRIRERCQALIEAPSLWKRSSAEAVVTTREFHQRFNDVVLFELLRPERQRQQRAMVEAMARVVEMLRCRPQAGSE